MDYPDPVASLVIVFFSRIVSVVRRDTQTHTQTDADECLTPTTVIDVSN